MFELNINAPWYTLAESLQVLFAGDPAVTVGEIIPGENGHPHILPIEVYSHDKYMALGAKLCTEWEFGKVALRIDLIDKTHENAVDAEVAIYDTIFEGNPILKDIRTTGDGIASRQHGFVRFCPDVLQFYNDDISAYKGLWSGLAQDIAREVFVDDALVSFCTADVRENAEAETAGDDAAETV